MLHFKSVCWKKPFQSLQVNDTTPDSLLFIETNERILVLHLTWKLIEEACLESRKDSMRFWVCRRDKWKTVRLTGIPLLADWSMSCTDCPTLETVGFYRGKVTLVSQHFWTLKFFSGQCFIILTSPKTTTREKVVWHPNSKKKYILGKRQRSSPTNPYVMRITATSPAIPGRYPFRSCPSPSSKLPTLARAVGNLRTFPFWSWHFLMIRMIPDQPLQSSMDPWSQSKFNELKLPNPTRWKYVHHDFRVETSDSVRLPQRSASQHFVENSCCYALNLAQTHPVLQVCWISNWLVGCYPQVR